ncbi:MAG: DUF1593 domain-containing protein [Candidatus Latescibacteria bacterium]|jgi:hypothetical protein|nr:DUF1593 domain-containing protein [Candidatus Latescibacterota bacterium]
MNVVKEAIDRYAQVLPNLHRHAKGYPDAEALQAIVKRGMTGVQFTLDKEDSAEVWAWIGEGKDTEGSEWIIEVVDQPDLRPVDVNVWGGPADLAQALWKVRETRSADALDEFVSKIRVHAIGDQDDTGPWIREEFPDLFYILDSARDGDKWQSCYRGMFMGGDMDLTSKAWIDAHVCEGHGPLGAFYPPETHTGKNPHKALKEGDTPSWFYFLENGLNLPGVPSVGGWGGRFEKNGTFWQDAEDTVNAETSGRATVWRWRPAFQRDFQARMDWCVQEQANHHPTVVVNGDSGKGVVEFSATSGDTVMLRASESSDPDGDTLSFVWFYYREAGTFEGDVAVNFSDAEAQIGIPEVASGKTIHVILEVTDDGDPPLTVHRRIVITVF